MSTGYGVETACTTGYKAGRLVSGWRVVAHALYRRITTPTGTLREDPAYGIDLAELVGSLGAGDIAALVRAQFMKDDRVESADVQAFESVATDGTISIRIEALVVLVNEGESFTFTTTATSGGVSELIAKAA